MRQFVYGRGDINILILRHLYEWSEDDQAALSDIVAARPKGKSLIILIEAQSRTNIDRSVLVPFYDEDGGLSEETISSIEVFLGEEPGFLELSDLTTPTTAGPILGVQEDNLRQEQVEAGIFSPDFAIADIIPLLVIGSTHFQPFTLKRKMSSTFSHYAPAFMEVLSKYAKVYTGDTDRVIDFVNDTAELERNLAEMRNASSILVAKRHIDQEQYYEFRGRHQLRSDLVSALAGIFENDLVKRKTYVVKLLCCGELNALEKLSEALNGDIDDIALVRSMRSLNAALFLKEERKALNRTPDSFAAFGRGGNDDHSVARSAILQSAWAKGMEAINEVCVNHPTREILRIGASLYARSFFIKKTPLNWQQDCEAGSLASFFHAEIDEALQIFNIMDRKLAKRLCERRLQSLLYYLPEKAQGELHERIKSSMSMGHDLSFFFDESSGVDDVFDIIKRHREITADVFATLYSTIIRTIPDDKGAFDLAEAVDVLRESGVKASAAGKPRGVTRSTKLAFSDWLKVLRDPRLVDLLIQHQSRSQNASEYHLFDVMYGSLGALKGTARKTTPISFSGGDFSYGATAVGFSGNSFSG